MKIVIFFLIVFFNLSAFSKDVADNEKWIMSNVIDDMLSCQSYYTIAADSMEKYGDKKNAEVIKEYSQKLSFMSFYLADSIKLKDETLSAKLDLTFKEQFESIDFDYSNISILIQKYADNCKEWYEDDFISRMHYWYDKYEKRFSN
jgi:hypothetical protein